MAATVVEFGPNKWPVWLARIVGIGACLFGAAMVALAILIAGEGAFLLVFLSLIGLGAAVFGGFFVWQGGCMARLRAVVSEDTLELTAHAGRHLWLQRGVASAVIPWNDVQGCTSMRTLNTASKTGTQITCILYTKQGDFTLVDRQWKDFTGLLAQISARSGRDPEQVAPERAEAKSEVRKGERRMSTFMRIFGWATVIVAIPLTLLILIAGLAQGFSVDLARAAGILLMVGGLGSSMIRYYRK